MDHPDFLSLYSNSRKLPLSQHNTVSSNVYTTNLRNLSLKDYYIAHKYYCELHHNKCVQQCDSMIKAGNESSDESPVDTESVHSVMPSSLKH